MSGATVLLLLGLLGVGAASPSARIVGGAVTSINQYPFTVSVLTLINNNWMQVCGGSILNNRSFLCAAHCFIYRPAANLRGRVGSTNAHSGGVVHNFAFYVNHPHYNEITVDNDIAVARVSSAFGFNNNVRAVGIAGTNYNLADGQSVWAAGWGLMSWGGQPSEQLRHVQIWTVNQETCRQRFSNLTPNMLCAAWLGVGGRGTCSRDSGGPLVHNGVLVGVTSFTSMDCGSATHPSVFSRVSRYTSWIQQNS